MVQGGAHKGSKKSQDESTEEKTTSEDKTESPKVLLALFPSILTSSSIAILHFSLIDQVVCFTVYAG